MKIAIISGKCFNISFILSKRQFANYISKALKVISHINGKTGFTYFVVFCICKLLSSSEFTFSFSGKISYYLMTPRKELMEGLKLRSLVRNLGTKNGRVIT